MLKVIQKLMKIEIFSDNAADKGITSMHYLKIFQFS